MKEPKTYQEQLKILQERGCAVEDEDEAVHVLMRIGYYRFSGYLLAYVNNEGVFKNGLTFCQVVSAYDFDRDLRGVVSKAVSEVEIAAKGLIAYHHGHKYGALGYLCAANYNQRHNHDIFIEQFNATVKNNRNALFVRHHLSKYGGQFPIWAATELFTMGMISIFYADLPSADKASIARQYGTSYDYLENWLRCTTVLRNICAHNGRLFDMKFQKDAKLPRKPFLQFNIIDRTLFKQMLMLKLLYSNQHKEWNETILNDLSLIMQKYTPRIKIEDFGFVDGWQQALLW